MRKTTIFTFTLLSSLAILPAVAQVQTGGGLGQVWSDFQSYSQDMQDYFQDNNNLKDTLNPLVEQGQSQNAIKSAKGDLNIPNPVLAGQNIRGYLNNDSYYNSDAKSSRFENNSAVRINLVSNELNRIITRGVAVGVLGKNGQTRTKTKLENIQDTIDDFGRNSPSLPDCPTTGDAIQRATCNLTKSLLDPNSQANQIQQEQVKIVAETFAQTLQNNQSLQYSNLNLANISQQTEEANRARRVDTSTEAARLLRATSQLDLFGSPSTEEVGK